MPAPNRLRDLEVFRLRRRGHTFAEIAERVGFKGAPAAHLAYQRALRLFGPVAQSIEEARAEEVDRLDRLLTKV